MLRKFISNLVQVFVIINIVSCGTKIQENHEKKYVLAYKGLDADAAVKFRQLVKEFNQEAGFEYLGYSDDPSKANSLITLTKGLELRDGKIGWGQWSTDTSDDESYTHRGTEVDRTINYSMDVELDWDYVMSRLQKNTELGNYELKKLFFHEVGHGLQMPHSKDPKNLMYPTINGEKNFEEFFTNVRIFFKN